MKTHLGLVLLIAALCVSVIGQAFASSPGFALTDSCNGEIWYYCGLNDTISVNSLNGFSGTVSLSTSITTYCINCSLAVALNPNNVTVSSGGSATSTLSLTTHVCHTSQSQRYCGWNIHVAGVSGSVTNSTDIFVCLGSKSCPT